MAKFSDQRKGGKNYLVRVTDTKRGQKVATIPVVARTVAAARQEAIFEATHQNLVMDSSRLFAHAPTRA